MEISDSFSKAFLVFKKHWTLLFASFASIVLLFACFFFLASASGARSVGHEFSVLQEKFIQENPQEQTSGLASLFQTQQAQDAYTDKFSKYLVEQGFMGRLSTLLTMANLRLIIIMIIIAALIGTLAATTLWVAAKDALIDNAVHWPGVLGESLRRFIPFIGLQLGKLLLYTIPIALVGVLNVIVFRASPLVGVLMFMIFILYAIVYLFWIGTRLAFTNAAFFIDGKGAFAAIKHAFAISKGKFKTTLFIMLIVTGIGLLVNTVTQEPFKEIATSYLLELSSTKVITVLLVGVCFALIQAAANAFRALFLYTAYKQFMEENNGRTN